MQRARHRNPGPQPARQGREGQHESHFDAGGRQQLEVRSIQAGQMGDRHNPSSFGPFRRDREESGRKP